MSHHHHHHGPPHHHPPPPPYNQPYPPHLHPPPPAAYAYVPAPVVMPMPVMPTYPPVVEPQPPQPTYVTNYIYTQPEQPTPVNVVNNAPPPQQYQDQIDWIPATTSNASQLAHKAVVAGKEPGWNSSPIWVIRAHHSGNLVPGKLAVNDRRAYIPVGGKEVPVHNFELTLSFLSAQDLLDYVDPVRVLSAPASSVRWLPSSNGQVPVGAIPAGNTHNGETLYIGRVKHRSSLTPGKVHPSHGCLYISFGGTEVPHKNYEVLCRIVG